jgi:hypothetical protein
LNPLVLECARAKCVLTDSERMLYVIGDARFRAKNRYPLLRNVL